MKKDTLLVTAGRDPHANFGIVNPPVYHASTILSRTLAESKEKRKDPHNNFTYGLRGTPTTVALEAAVAALEGGEKCVVLPTGLAAITVTLLAFTKPGDHILVTDNAYEPTHKFCNLWLKKFGIEVTYFDPMVGAGIEKYIRSETRMVLLESPGSLTFEVQDVPAIAAAAHDHDVLVAIDNTWSAGYYFDAFQHGCDISLQAGTKYIVGHSDAMLGTITSSEKLWLTLKDTTHQFGFHTAPDDCYLGMRGLRSIAARMPRHQETALTLACWLAKRPEVETVLHPALPSCSGHDIWKRDFTGSSGLFGVVLKEGFSEIAVAAMVDNLELFGIGASWGGFESLITVPNPAGLRTVVPWLHKGPSLRLNCGLEDAGDLVNDIESGLARLNASA